VYAYGEGGHAVFEYAGEQVLQRHVFVAAGAALHRHAVRHQSHVSQPTTKGLVTNRKFFGDFDPFGDFDLIFGAYKLNLKIVEVPIRYKERKYGTTNISRFRHGLILLKMCVFAARKIKFR
jgi:hypothetical protein